MALCTYLKTWLYVKRKTSWYHDMPFLSVPHWLVIGWFMQHIFAFNPLKSLINNIFGFTHNMLSCCWYLKHSFAHSVCFSRMFVPLNTELMLDICCPNSVTSNIPPKMHFRDVKQGLMMGYLVIPVVFDWPWTICHRLWMEQKAELQYLCSCCHRLMSFTYIHFIFSLACLFPQLHPALILYKLLW